MIEIISGLELDRQPKLREAMHQLRYRVFAERLGWNVTTQGQLERDQFDDLNPLYLLAFDDENALVGTWRMLPTTNSYMLKDVFPQLLDGKSPPRSPLVWEGSRFAVDCRKLLRNGMGTPSRATAEIFCAVVEFGLALDLSEVVTVYDHRIARLLSRIGCHAKWQSMPHRIDNTLAFAGRFDIDHKALDRIRAANGIDGPVVQRAPWINRRTAA